MESSEQIVITLADGRAINTRHRPGRENVVDSLSCCTVSEAFTIAVSVEQEPNIKDQLEQGYTMDRVLAPISD